MELHEQKGDLFSLPPIYALAHCVSQDCEDPRSWGKGIATEFKKKFKHMKNYCAETIYQEGLQCPCVVYYPFGGQKVFNLITKEVYYAKPSYTTITKCIERMAEICKVENIKYLAMPKIGCGLDRLQWSIVKEIVENVFKDIDINIEVRYLK